MSNLLDLPNSFRSGDLALAQVEKIGRNTSLELANGRRCALHEGDLIAVAFGNRYATGQFEGYARATGSACDLLSMGGVCGMVESKHASMIEPSKLRLLGLLAGADKHPLQLREFALAPVALQGRPGVIGVCGTSMDAGKTYTAMSLVIGLRLHGERVASIKLTGTATGRDTWTMLDAGSCRALDFVDGGLPSTYLAAPDELLDLFDLLLAHAGAPKPSWVVVEIADGLLQRETAALLQAQRLTARVDAWLLAAGEPLAAAGGVCRLAGWGIQPLAICGLTSMSALAVQETVAATGLPCWTAQELQSGDWSVRLPQRPAGALLAAALSTPEIA